MTINVLMKTFSQLPEFEAALDLPAAEFGPAISEIFRDWRAQDDFDCRDFMPVMENLFGRPYNNNLIKVAQTALALGSNVSPNDYHSHHHNREVAALTIALLYENNAVSEYRDSSKPLISADMAWLSVITAAIHDYDHDGTGNKVDGVVVPMRLENNSLHAALPALKASGLTQDEWTKICMMLLPTDITATERPSPSAQLGEIFGYHMSNGVNYDKIDPLFYPLLQNAELAACAQIISDADLGISAGLDPEMARLNSVLLDRETKGAVPSTPKSFAGFLQYVCADFPRSDAGKYLLSPGLETIRAQNARELNTHPEYRYT